MAFGDYNWQHDLIASLPHCKLTASAKECELYFLGAPEPGGAAQDARIAKGVFHDPRRRLRHEGMAGDASSRGRTIAAAVANTSAC